jgi:hypothetical protein
MMRNFPVSLKSYRNESSGINPKYARDHEEYVD